MDDKGSTQHQVIDYVEKEFQKALELHDTGNFDEAASLYQDLLRLYPLNSLILNSYGTLLYQQGNLLDGYRVIKRSIIFTPNISVFYNRLGVISRAQGDLDEARKMFERALSIEEQYEANFFEDEFNLNVTRLKTNKLDFTEITCSPYIKSNKEEEDNTFEELI